MASPVPDTYVADSGQAIYAGRHFVGTLDNVSIASEDSGVPDPAVPNQVMVVQLHGSGGQDLIHGRQFRADVTGLMAYSTYNQFAFATLTGGAGITILRPVDGYGTYPSGGIRESMWFGFKHIPNADFVLITQRRLEAMLVWAATNVANINPVKTCLTGGSMGGWGTLLFGLRRPSVFAALYPDRPRWRWDATIGEIAVPDWTFQLDSLVPSAAPNLCKADGLNVTMYSRMDHISYVADTANKIRWIGWCVGRQDGFTNFSDHIDAVAALRSAKRGFAFYWNNGNHSGGSQPQQITNSYPYGMFELGKGYPLFTNHSLDNDPNVDLVGGINIGLSFRNVTESATGWSCEVTSIVSACTVDVEPISDVFTRTVTSQHVTIPAANSWVSVSF